MVASSNKHPLVFISHADEDREFARTVAQELTEAGFASWTLDEVLPGDNAFLKLGHALESSDALVILLSPEAVQSPNLTYELGYAYGLQRFADRVIPVLLRPTKKVPWMLDRMQMIRPGNSPKRAAKKIVDRLSQTAEV